MIDFYYAPSPNGWKVGIMLEELGVPYNPIKIDVRSGESRRPRYLEINPNGKIPAILDRSATPGGNVRIFESGAILIYLSEKHGRFLSTDIGERYRTIQWLMWQMSGFGPTLGQHGHFVLYAPEKIPYAISRFRQEAERLYSVLDAAIGDDRASICAEYSIADMACFPWAMTHKAQGIDLSKYPNVRRWFTALRSRPQVQRAIQLGRSENQPLIPERTA